MEAAGGRGLGARPRRARHVVQLGAVAVRDARLARGHRRAARLLPDRRALDGARHPLPVGGAHGDDGARVRRRRPVHRRLRALGDPGAGRAADEQVAGHGDRPARRDRPPRRRRRALRPAGDVLDPGRALQRREGRAGPGAGQQALQRVALRAAQRRRGRRARAAAANGRGPLDPVAPAARHGRHRRTHRGLRLRQGRARALRLRLRRAVRLVPGADQGPRVRRGALGHAPARAARDAGARPSGDPVRDRGAVGGGARGRRPAGRRAATPSPTTRCSTSRPSARSRRSSPR